MLVWLSPGYLVFTIFYIPIKFLRFQVVHAAMEYYDWIRPVHLSAIYCIYGCYVAGLLLMDRMQAAGCPGAFGKET